MAASYLLAARASGVLTVVRVIAILTVLLAGCSTMTLRAGVSVVGDRPAFEVGFEVGASAGSRHHVQITHGHFVSANTETMYLATFNVDYVSIDRDLGPIARIGAHARISDEANAVMMRGAMFTGIGRDPKTRAGGLGFEIAGGLDPDRMRPAYEASIVMHGRWNID